EIPHTHIGRATKPGACEQRRHAVGGGFRTEVDAAHERRVEGKEAGNLGAARVVDRYNGYAARAGAGEDDRLALEVSERDIYTTDEARIKGVEAGNELSGTAVIRGHVRPAARAGPGDDIDLAVAIDVAARDADAAVERGV